MSTKDINRTLEIVNAVVNSPALDKLMNEISNAHKDKMEILHRKYDIKELELHYKYNPKLVNQIFSNGSENNQLYYRLKSRLYLYLNNLKKVSFKLLNK